MTCGSVVASWHGHAPYIAHIKFAPVTLLGTLECLSSVLGVTRFTLFRIEIGFYLHGAKTYYHLPPEQNICCSV